MTKSRGILVRRNWTEVENELLRRNFADSRTQDIADALGRPYHQVAARALRMGLRKAPEWLQSPASGRDNLGRGVASRFRPGQQAWNKGMKGLQLAPEATRFKPGVTSGRAAQLEMPVGSYRINDDGYLERKVSDQPGPQTRRWKVVHRLVWEAAHGPIQPGMCVVFRDGRRTTDPDEITVDRLECISQRELMRRNTVHRYGPELARLIQLRGALVRQINRKAAQAAETHDE